MGWLKRSRVRKWSLTLRIRRRLRTRRFWSSSRRQGGISWLGKRSRRVRHHLALSVVGTDRLLASGYFRAKLAQENLIKASNIPYTIVRATQFFEFVGAIAESATAGQTVRLPPALMQPVASDDVAAVLATVAVEKPWNRTIELAGPELIRMDELVRRFLNANGDERRVTTDVHALYFGTKVNDQSLTPGERPRIGPTRFEDWLASRSMMVAH